MGYSPSPRPTFDGPAAIPFQSVTRHLWGDPVSGEVADWIYVSSGLIHQLVFGLPPGGAFLHSENFRTVFAADELLPTKWILFAHYGAQDTSSQLPAWGIC